MQDEKRMTFSQPITPIWEEMAKNGNLVSRFNDSDGRNIELGLRRNGDHLEPFAKDLDSGRDLDAGIGV